MNQSSAPALATFLMDRVGNCDPVLIGDLEEEYRGGRSRLWFWHEAIHATAASIVRTVRQHPRLLLRAVAALWAVNAVIGLALHELTQMQLLLRIVPIRLYTGYQLYAVLEILISAPASTFAAWWVARLHARVRAPAVLVVVALSLPAIAVNPELHRLWANMPEPRFIPYLILDVARILTWLTGMLLGGVLLPLRADRERADLAGSPASP